MSKRPREYDPVEYERDLKRIALDRGLEGGLWTPLADIDVFLATSYLSADALFALSLTCKRARASLPLPPLSSALAHALAAGRGTVYEWLKTTFIPRGDDFLWDYGGYELSGDTPSCADEGALGLMHLRIDYGHLDRPPLWDGTLCPEQVECFAVHPIVANTTQQSVLAGLFADLAVMNMTLTTVGSWVDHFLAARDVVHVDWLDVFYAVLRVGNVEHIAFHYYVIIRNPHYAIALDKLIGLSHAAYGGRDAAEFYWLNVIRGPLEDDQRRGLTDVWSRALLAMFFRLYWQWAPDVQGYFISDVFGAHVYNKRDRPYEGLRLTYPPLAEMRSMCKSVADLRMLISVLVSMIGDDRRNVHELPSAWTTALIGLLADTNDNRIFAILEKTVACETLHQQALAFTGTLSQSIWLRILRQWPYRYQILYDTQLDQHHARILAPSYWYKGHKNAQHNALNVLAWACVVPFNLIGDQSILSHVCHILRDVPVDTLISTYVAPLVLPVSSVLFEWARSPVDWQRPLLVLLRRRLNHTEAVRTQGRSLVDGRQ
jgi:hypothetical protein